MIKLQLKKSVCLKKDIYRIKKDVSDIVVNDNYKGLLIFDEKLELQKRLDFNQSGTLVDRIFVANSWILIDSTEELFFLLINKEFNQCFTIRVNSDPRLTPLYHFDRDNFILYTSYEEFVAVNIITKSYCYIASETIKDNYPDFFELCRLFSYYRPFAVDLTNKTFFYHPEDHKIWSFQHNQNNKETFLGQALRDTFSVTYMNNVPLVIADTQIYTFINQQPTILLNGSYSELYRGIAILNSDQFILLSRETIPYLKSYLRLYQVMK